MINYNGVELESVAPVMVEDIKVSPIEMTATARQLPIRWGAEYVRMTGGSRTVEISFGLLVDKPEIRTAHIMEITKWARANEPKRLLLPYYSGKCLEAICTALPAPSMRQWWENKLRLTFTTFDNPYWTDTSEKSVACGTAFNVLGTAPPLARIERTLTASASDQVYGDGVDTMTFSTIPAGDLVIDLDKQTAAVNGASIMQYYTFDSSFIRAEPGANTITGTGTVYWRERWE